MSPVEIIAYKGGRGKTKFGEIEVFEGTEEQLTELRQQLVENWETIGAERIKIVYQGVDMTAAKKSIKGLPRISEEIGI